MKALTGRTNYTDENSELLGFDKKGKPVMSTYKNEHQQVRKTVVIKTDSKSGKTYLTSSNGKIIEVNASKYIKNVIGIPFVCKLPTKQVNKSSISSNSDSPGNSANLVTSDSKTNVKKKNNKPMQCNKFTSTSDLINYCDSINQTDVTIRTSISCQTEPEPLIVSGYSPFSSPLPEIESLDNWIHSEENNCESVAMTPSSSNLFDLSSSTPNCNNQAASNNFRMKFFIDLKQCDKFDVSGNLPIHTAVLNNSVNDVKRQCLVSKIRKLDINITNSMNLTSLQLAIINDVNSEIIMTLVNAGSDISVTDSNGNNVIHSAVMYSHYNILNYLLSVAKSRNFSIDLFNYEGLTPLIICALESKLEWAETLLEHGADPNIRDKKSGRTALFHAVENNDEKMVRLLHQKGADPKVRNFVGTSTHDAMFELDSIKQEIKLWILGKEPITKKVEKKPNKRSRENSNRDNAEEKKQAKTIKLSGKPYSIQCNDSGKKLLIVSTLQKINNT